MGLHIGEMMDETYHLDTTKLKDETLDELEDFYGKEIDNISDQQIIEYLTNNEEEN